MTPCLSRRRENVYSGFEIRVKGRQNMLQVGGSHHVAGQVVNRVGFYHSEEFADRLYAADVTRVPCHLHAVSALRVSRDPVDHGSALYQALTKMRADESRCTGDQHPLAANARGSF